MFALLDKSFSLLASQLPASSDQLSQLKRLYPSVPDEYLALLKEATEVELQHQDGQYLRIWSPEGCIGMDMGYDISTRIPNAIPIGDDGGGRVLCYMKGNSGFGVYHIGYGGLDAEDAVFAAPSLAALLGQAIGIDTF